MPFAVQIGGRGAPVQFTPNSSIPTVQMIQQEIAQSTFTGANITARKLQLLAAKANTCFVATHMSLEVNIGVAFTNNPTNLVLSQMADPNTGSEGDLSDGTFGFRGDGALGTVGRFVHYQANMLTLNVGTNQVGITQAGQPLWLVPRAQLTGAGTLTKAILTVLYYEVVVG